MIYGLILYLLIGINFSSFKAIYDKSFSKMKIFEKGIYIIYYTIMWLFWLLAQEVFLFSNRERGGKR